MPKETNQSDDSKLIQDIADLKKEVKDIGFKVDIMLEILNSFTIMLSEDDESLEDDEDNESWVSPEQDEDWNTYDDENDDEY